MEPDDAAAPYPLTDEEIHLRRALALPELDEEIASSWVEHQDWCALVLDYGGCSCGVAANVWFAGPTRVVGVGIDRRPHVYVKH